MKINKRPNIVLPVPLGKDSSGRDHGESLLNPNHILIAGATGSGKSIFNHVLISSLISCYSPTELKLFLADPKRVEFRNFYNGLPHLIAEVGEKPELILTELSSINQERVRRLSFSNNESLPYIVVIIDTFSDLGFYDPKRFESLIKDLTSNSEKTKIHVVMCDSRPSEDLFTESLKSRFPTKIAFATSRAEDSVRVIGQEGAEKLNGRGDMLFLAPGARNPIRLQGFLITDKEVEKNVADIKKKWAQTTT